MSSTSGSFEHLSPAEKRAQLKRLLSRKALEPKTAPVTTHMDRRELKKSYTARKLCQPGCSDSWQIPFARNRSNAVRG